jgi:hypothetical protein
MDPLGFGGGDVNLYAYCGGNPVGGSDPSGMDDNPFSQLNDEGYALARDTDRMIMNAADTVISWTPFVGNARESVRSARRGDRRGAAFYAGMAVVDVVGGGTEGHAVEEVGEVALKRMAAPVVKREAEHLAGASVGIGTRGLGEHTAERGATEVVANTAKKEKAWKDIIHGKAQKTGPGHQMRSYRIAIRMAKSGKYEEVHLNRSYEAITKTKTFPRRSADVVGVRKSGRLVSVEIASVRDVPSVLRQRNLTAMSQLPKRLQGKVAVMPYGYPRRLE